MSVDYNHSENLHTLGGPAAALPILLASHAPASLLDVGCGTGTWLKAAMDIGITDVVGVDGAELLPERLHVPASKFRHVDLTGSWNLNRRFEVALCVEVAEHLDEGFAAALIDALVGHSDWIFFSAACPGQEGQHHVNCQWPAYWQRMFNHRGFTCSDEPRWQIWNEPRIEAWYRQNLFVARRDVAAAGREPRIKSVLHPEMLPSILTSNERFEKHVGQIERGRMRALWYLKTPPRALAAKIKGSLS